VNEIVSAVKTDLPRFIPQNIYSVYEENNFNEFVGALKNIISSLLDQGMKEYLEDYERR